MATKKSQRIAIWVIAGALLIGTIGSFLVLILAPQNNAADQARLEELMAEYQAENSAYQERVTNQANALSETYYSDFLQYQSRAAAFDADSIEGLETTELKQGNGEELTSESEFTAYYIGWNPSGTVFDSSIDDEAKKLRAPLTAGPGMVIPGWTQGVVGMKVGGVRELSIPSDLAYGEMGQGEDIPPNTPLRFVIMVIPTPDSFGEPPEPSQELLRLYERVGM